MVPTGSHLAVFFSEDFVNADHSGQQQALSSAAARLAARCGAVRCGAGPRGIEKKKVGLGLC